MNDKGMIWFLFSTKLHAAKKEVTFQKI